MPITGYSNTISVTTLALLDQYPNAAAAYSLRKLRSAYTGSAIRVRRSSDNTEQDIGFSSTFGLDTSSLTSFCGAGNGFVTTWYDQSGNGYNATQSTAANQPQIVSGGSVIVQSSKPTLRTNGSSFLSNSSIPNYGAINSIFFTIYLPSSRQVMAMMSAATNSNNQLFPSRDSNGNNRYYDSNSDITASPLPTGLNLISIFENNTVLNVYENNSQLVNNGVCDNASAIGIILFQRAAGNGLINNSTISEVIVYSSNVINNQLNIRTNINSYYGIY